MFVSAREAFERLSLIMLAVMLSLFCRAPKTIVASTRVLILFEFAENAFQLLDFAAELDDFGALLEETNFWLLLDSSRSFVPLEEEISSSSGGNTRRTTGNSKIYQTASGLDRDIREDVYERRFVERYRDT